MNEYIKREEIRRAYEKLTRSYVNGNPYIADWRFDEMIEKLPAADVAPVVHGRWISYLDGDSIMPERRYRCSECCDRGWGRKLPYCPNCGAKMDDELNE